MELRAELLPPVVSDEWLAEVGAEISRIEDLVVHGDRAEACAAVAAFNKRTGHAYEASDFADYSAWRGLEDFAREAARPAWPRVEGVTRDELAEVVRRILGAQGSADADYYLLLLEANVPHPAVSGLIYHPPAELADASPEAIVEAAMSYRAIAPPPRPVVSP